LIPAVFKALLRHPTENSRQLLSWPSEPENLIASQDGRDFPYIRRLHGIDGALMGGDDNGIALE
jgi:hypothetical protein